MNLHIYPHFTSLDVHTLQDKIDAIQKACTRIILERARDEHKGTRFSVLVWTINPSGVIQVFHRQCKPTTQVSDLLIVVYELWMKELKTRRWDKVNVLPTLPIEKTDEEIITANEARAALIARWLDEAKIVDLPHPVFQKVENGILQIVSKCS
ncbi:MAG: hypothetical protein HQ402_01380 [Parcubacteria group bacterium]|nr:hypothetical protein [Parcubacteria group bacterium]